MNKNTAIIVGTGFIGSHICKILENDFQIVAIDNNKNNLFTRPILLKLNLTFDKKDTETVFNNIFETTRSNCFSEFIGCRSNSDDNFVEFEAQDINEFEEV